ncbi:MAG: aldehyde dehydrogenase family protein, partial [Halobacteriovoraceae bacterium]|nr:aldehyde dehydrogenase family protein [Halobacteriovoraceae bacterium]
MAASRKRSSSFKAKGSPARALSASKKKTAKKKVAKKKTKVTKKKAVAKKVTHKAPTKGLVFNYSPAPESSAVVNLQDKYKHFINGEFVAPSSGKYFESVNPANGKALAKVAHGNAKDVDVAVEAAESAYNNTWSKLSGKERGRYLYRIARILQERAREFSVLETLDGGKTIKESRDVDIPLAAAHFFYHAGWADKLEYAFPGKKVKPIGVVGQIIPWNFPLLMAAWKIA